jgi:hypothetical protein
VPSATTVKRQFSNVVDMRFSLYSVWVLQDYGCVTAIYQPVDLRDAFFSLSFFLLASLRSMAPRVGFDLRRGAAGGLAASSSKRIN